MSNGMTFEYGGYHFTPVRQFHKKEGDFFTLSKRLESDPELGLSEYEQRQKFPYHYKDFYAAATDKTCDIFRCEENGKLYVPAARELFIYHDPFCKDTIRKSVLTGLKENAPCAEEYISNKHQNKESEHGR